jgi:hypothetical protein
VIGKTLTQPVARDDFGCRVRFSRLSFETPNTAVVDENVVSAKGRRGVACPATASSSGSSRRRREDSGTGGAQNAHDG